MRPASWLAPLVPAYSALVRGKNLAYDHGLLPIDTLQRPVISIGNLSTGGSGKTPVVIALANLLRANGISIDVLSRGYGRNSSETLSVPETGDASVDEYGDEPLLIARSTGAPVFVGRSRYAAGLLAEKSAMTAHHVHLLDDGFQHRQLTRDLDVVVLHASDLTARLLPAGHLREPRSSLKRAEVVVVREEDRDAVSAMKRYLDAGVQVWHIRRILVGEISEPVPVIAFCGIARPQEFFAGLSAQGVEVAAVLPFADHHLYSDADVRMLLDACRKAKTTRLVTTEKDAVRLSSKAKAVFNNGYSLTVAKLEAVFLEPDAVLKTVRTLTAARDTGR